MQAKNKTPKQNAITALECGIPEGLVPTFELEFQLTQELLGVEYHVGAVWQSATKNREEKDVPRKRRVVR